MYNQKELFIRVRDEGRNHDRFSLRTLRFSIYSLRELLTIVQLARRSVLQASRGIAE